MTYIARVVQLIAFSLAMLGSSIAAADHGGPSHNIFTISLPPTSSTGNYTITWSVNNSAVTIEEKLNSGSYSAVHAGLGTSMSFTNKPDGTYSYRVKFDFCYFGGCFTSYSLPFLIVVNTGSSGGPGSGNDGIAASPVLETPQAIGVTAYSADVTNIGDSVITIPINVVDGMRGFQPNLQIAYSSGRGVDRYNRSIPEDTIGYGWFLSGLPEIRRCVVDQPSGQSISLNSNDSLCFDGTPLVLVEGSHLSVGAKYRTKFDNFAEITVKGTVGDIHFEAKLPDGTLGLFGSTSNGKVNYNGGVDYQWSFDKSIDAFGNEIAVEYFKPSLKGTNYPTRIDYTDAVVEFKYEQRTDASSVLIHTSPQTRSVFLHTIAISYDNKPVRDYLLIDEVVSGSKRLSAVQECGYSILGTNKECLDPIEVSWYQPASTMTGVEFLVDEIVDTLGAETVFQYQTVHQHYSGPTFTELPAAWGSFSLPVNSTYLTTSGARRHVVSKFRRDNGLGAGSYSDIDYAYWGQPITSTKNWGFLGFAAQRVTDTSLSTETTVAYIQNRLDAPHYRKVSRSYQYDGLVSQSANLMSARDFDYETNTYSGWTTGSTTEFPYLKTAVHKVYENGVIRSVSKTVNDLVFTQSLIDSIDTATETGTGVSHSTSLPSVWGDIENISVTGIERTVESESQLLNRDSSGEWLIGFTSTQDITSWDGAKAAPGVTSIYQNAVYTPDSRSLDIEVEEFYPNHAGTLNLKNTYTYDSAGRLENKRTEGTDIVTRNYTSSEFKLDRYIGKTSVQFNHERIVSSYDHRFGSPSSKGDLNNNITLTSRDPFGRVIDMSPEGQPGMSISYNRCTPALCPTSYGVQPVMFIESYRRNSSNEEIIVPQKVYLDALGRPVRSELKSVQGTWSRVDRSYDSRGRLLYESQPYFAGSTIYSTSFAYDNYNRLTSVSSADGGLVAIDYSVSGKRSVTKTTETIVSSIGAPDATSIARHEYNSLGELVKTVEGYSSPESTTTLFTYDAQGNLKTVEAASGQPYSSLTAFSYDESGNIISVDSPDDGLTTFTYTALNELRTSSDSAGRTFFFLYDVLGRTLQRHSSVDGVSKWFWDGQSKGKLSKKENSTYDESYTYDSFGRLESTTFEVTPIGGSVSESFTAYVDYDSYGRPNETTYVGPADRKIIGTYNSNGYLSELNQEGKYLPVPGPSLIKRTLSSDAFGNATYEIFGDLGNSTSKYNVYDQASGRLDSRSAIRQGGQTIQSSDFYWRSDGTLERRVQNSVSGLSGTRTEDFAYDSQRRLKSASASSSGSPTRNLVYDYDKLGNLLYKTSNKAGDLDVTNYGYGAGTAGPSAVTSATVGGVPYTLNYNSVGAVSSYDLPGNTEDRFVVYNSFNQPTTIVVGTSLLDANPKAKEEMAYGPDGRLIAKKTTWNEGGSSYTAESLYLGATERITVNGPNGYSQNYTTDINSDVQHSKINGLGPAVHFVEYVHRDHLGSPEVITDYSGSVVDRMAFDPFGRRRAADWSADIGPAELADLLHSSSTSQSRKRGLTDHEHLDRSGFIHMNGRVFDQTLGRFISPDPFVGNPASGQSWNSYSYVRNSALSRIDPTGFLEESLDEVPGDVDGENAVLKHLQYLIRLSEQSELYGWLEGLGYADQYRGYAFELHFVDQTQSGSFSGDERSPASIIATEAAQADFPNDFEFRQIFERALNRNVAQLNIHASRPNSQYHNEPLGTFILSRRFASGYKLGNTNVETVESNTSAFGTAIGGTRVARVVIWTEPSLSGRNFEQFRNLSQKAGFPTYLVLTSHESYVTQAPFGGGNFARRSYSISGAIRISGSPADRSRGSTCIVLLQQAVCP